MSSKHIKKAAKKTLRKVGLLKERQYLPPPKKLLTVQDAEDLIILLQMGRVGSKHIVRSLQHQGKQCVEVHFLSDHFLEKGRSLHVHKELPLSTAELWLRLEYEYKFTRLFLRRTSNKTKVKILSIVREPVSHLVSYYFIHLKGYFEPFIKERYDDLTYKTVTQHFTDCCSAYVDSLNGRSIKDLPIDQQFFIYLVMLSSDYFHYEFEDNLSIAIFSVSFDHEEEVLKTGNERYDCLVVRYKDISGVGEKHIREFINTPDFSLEKTKVNTNTQKGHGELYRRFLKEYSFDEVFLNDRYETQFATHFYTQEEIQTFKKKWRK